MSQTPNRLRIEEQLRLLSLARRLLPARSAPYFGHMRLESRGRTSDLLLGSETRAGAEISIIDWQRAPVAEAFFGCLEGDTYEIDIGERTLEGRLLQRNLLRFSDGELVEIATPSVQLCRLGPNRWEERACGPTPRLAPRPRLLRVLRAEVKLDAAQRRLVELPRGRACLILGEAGCGKTTVALHRVAHLRRTAKGPFRAAVIVPTEGLRRLVEALLARLGATDGIEVWLYDAWAAREAHRSFPDIPHRESRDATAAVMRIKRHPALHPLLEEVSRLPPALPDEDETIVPSSAWAKRHDLQRLFGDRTLLARLAVEGFASQSLDETFEHTRIQFTRTSEEELAHVDRARLATLDGLALDEGTPMEDAQTIDPEDYAVLFDLDRLRAERHGASPAGVTRYDCIVLDEAQELAPIELRLIGRSLASGGTLVVAGDAEQQLDPTTFFAGWPAAMKELGIPDFETATLQESYRCPRGVTAFAQRLIGVRAPAASGSRRSSVAMPLFESELHLAAWLADATRDLLEHDPQASVAIIARTAAQASRLFGFVQHAVPAELALDGAFSFTGGVHVTCVEEVKGLEFDHVIVPDASVLSYPDSRHSRRALYVAATRATRQLVIAAVGQRTSLARSSGEANGPRI